MNLKASERKKKVENLQLPFSKILNDEAFEHAKSTFLSEREVIKEQKG